MLVGLVGAVAFIGLVAWIEVRGVRYELDSNCLIIFLVGLPVRKVAYIDIESIRPGHALFGENWHSIRNGLCFGKGITIRRHRGIFKSMNLSPDDPQDFIQKIESKRRALTGIGSA